MAPRDRRDRRSCMLTPRSPRRPALPACRSTSSTMRRFRPSSCRRSWIARRSWSRSRAAASRRCLRHACARASRCCSIDSWGGSPRFADRWRQRSAAAIPDPGSAGEFYDWLLDGPVATAVRAGRDDACGSTARGRTRHRAPESVRARSSLVGAGPGDPGLLTLRALRALQQADVILADRLVVHGDPRAWRAAKRKSSTSARPPGGEGASQERINHLLVAPCAPRPACRAPERR